MGMELELVAISKTVITSRESKSSIVGKLIKLRNIFFANSKYRMPDSSAVTAIVLPQRIRDIQPTDELARGG